MKKLIFKSIIDGVLNFVCYIILMWFTVSVFVDTMASMQALLVVASVNGALMALLYFLFLRKERSVKCIVTFTAISFLAFALLFSIWFVCSVSFGINYPFARELGNGDGLLVMFTLGAYFVVNLLFRFVVFIALVIRRISALNKESNDM